MLIFRIVSYQGVLVKTMQDGRCEWKGSNAYGKYHRCYGQSVGQVCPTQFKLWWMNEEFPSNSGQCYLLWNFIFSVCKQDNKSNYATEVGWETSAKDSDTLLINIIIIVIIEDDPQTKSVKELNSHAGKKSEVFLINLHWHLSSGTAMQFSWRQKFKTRMKLIFLIRIHKRLYRNTLGINTNRMG